VSRRRKSTRSAESKAPAVRQRRRVPWIGAGFAAIAAVIIGVLLIRAAPPDGASTPLPPPNAGEVTANVSPADFVGADRCASCHEPQFAAWSGSTHARAGGVPSPRTVIAPFDGSAIRFRDAMVIPRRTGTRYEFVVRQTGREAVVLPVDGVVGGGHMEGGGTQGFLTGAGDGTLRFLPFDYSRQLRTWFCNTGTRAEKGWIPITESVALADCGDWPPVRVLGDVTRFANCQGCHGSQILAHFDTAAHRFETSFTSLAINCESCHGPGRRHVEIAESGRLARSADIGMASLTTLGEDASLEVCFACHAIKDRVRDGYLSGARLDRFYSLGLPLLGDVPLLPDGRVRTFAYQENHRYADCYLNGTLTCATCHDPHSQGYRTVTGRALASRFAEEQCTSCHASKAAEPTRHTFHEAGSAGSRCVSCHMPYIQHPELGDAVPYARADHSIPIPRPAADSALGVTSACAACHEDKSTTALARQVADWYGTLKPRHSVVASQLRAEGATSDEDAKLALLGGDGAHPFARAAGLSRLLDAHLTRANTELPASVVRRLEELSRSDDLDVRALALAALHLAGGEIPRVRRRLVEALQQAGAEEDPLRRRWAIVLGQRADALVETGRAVDAVAVYRLALEIAPDDPRIHLNLGIAQRAAGDLAGAIDSYRRSAALAPDDPLALVNLGIALADGGDTLSAERALRRAIEIAPTEPLAHYNLANYALVRGDAAGAAAGYRRAVSLDPALAPAHVNLARAHIVLREYREALAAVERALEFAPGDAEARQMRALLARQLGGEQ
jgi:Flp pilus assembly protein TadD